MSTTMRLDLHSDLHRAEPADTTSLQRVPAKRRTALLEQDAPLLMQARASEGLTGGLVERCAAAGLGAIYATTKTHDMVALINRHQQLHAGPVLFDAERYAGKGRDGASGHLDPDWTAYQRRIGIPQPLTDSPYIAANNHARLAAVLKEGANQSKAITTLPLAKHWITNRADELVDQINRFGNPVALMVEDRNDPFATEAAVLGLLHVLAHADVPVLQLRCDITAIGALAFGASHAAIGTSTSRRHIWPPTGGGPTKREPAAYVPASMSHRSLSTIGLAIPHFSDDLRLWTCDCDFCAGATLDHIATETEAAMHSLHCLASLATKVMGNDPTVSVRSWIEACRHALSVNQEISAKLVKNWPVPGNLKAWIKATR